jgi:hypothetical protein
LQLFTWKSLQRVEENSLGILDRIFHFEITGMGFPFRSTAAIEAPAPNMKTTLPSLSWLSKKLRISITLALSSQILHRVVVEKPAGIHTGLLFDTARWESV